MNTTASSSRRWLWASMPLLFLPLLFWWLWPRPREVIYDLYRERGRAKALDALQGYRSRHSEHFEVLVRDSDQNMADLILETAEEVYEPVVQQVGYRPEGKIPLIVYASRNELRQAFGWGNGESAMGVYWSGTIRLLSPNVWVRETVPREQRKVFKKLNPIAHELTHYVLDYMTNGNYPRWFTEGLAQRVEYKVTGFLWLEDESTLRQELYTLEQLEKQFDQLDNQPLAYRQSFLLVDFMARTYGEDSLNKLILKLSQGHSFSQAVRSATNTSMAEIHAGWLDWVSRHLDQLDRTG